MPRVDLSNAHRDMLVSLYEAQPRTLDDLPDTEEFETLYTAFVARSGLTVTRRDVWRALANCRKASKLPRKER